MGIHNLRIAIAEAIDGTEFAGNAYFTGGAVRDLLIHRHTDDFDITVNLPEGGIKLANFIHHELQSSQPVEYPEFGTAHILLHGHKIEFVMTRKEIYEPNNRNPRVSFGSLEEDVWRRDFSINALLLSITGGNLKDISGMGLKDLHEGLIRCLKDPNLSFGEDPLRMLRAIRFATLLGFRIEEDTWQALRTQAPRITSISKKRISDEFAKIMVARPSKHKGTKLDPEGVAVARGFELLLESGIMDYIVPEDQKKLEALSESSFSLTNKDLIEHFGALAPDKLNSLLYQAQKSWYENPGLSNADLLALLKEKSN